MSGSHTEAWTLRYCWPNDDFFGPAPHYAFGGADDVAFPTVASLAAIVLVDRPYCMIGPDVDLPNDGSQHAWARDNLDWENPDGIGTAEPFGPYIV